MTAPTAFPSAPRLRFTFRDKVVLVAHLRSQRDGYQKQHDTTRSPYEQGYCNGQIDHIDFILDYLSTVD